MLDKVGSYCMGATKFACYTLIAYSASYNESMLLLFIIGAEKRSSWKAVDGDVIIIEAITKDLLLLLDLSINQWKRDVLWKYLS